MNIHDYIENFRHGYDVVRGKMDRFEYYDFERNFINHINDNRYTIIKKSRQMHITTLLSNYVAWKLLFSDDIETITYISNKMDMSYNFIKLVRDNINYFIHVMDSNNITYANTVEITNKKEIVLYNGNRIRGTSSSSDAVKGYATTLIILDEAAFINQLDVMLGAIMSSLGIGGKVIMASTPNGIDKAFHKTWEVSVKGETEFKRMELNWKDNPRYSDEWFEQMKKTMYYDERMIAQELYGEFVSYIPEPKLFMVDKPKIMSTKDRPLGFKLSFGNSKIEKVVDNSFSGRIKQIIKSIFSFLKCG